MAALDSGGKGEGGGVKKFVYLSIDWLIIQWNFDEIFLSDQSNPRGGKWLIELLSKG